jgi:hypothetical protein
MKKLPVFALVIFLVAGCVPSWNPLYTEKDLIFDPQLIGAWKGEDGEVWKFEKEDEKNYKLTYTDKKGKATFLAHLLKIKERRFLDLYLHDDAEKDLNLNALATMTIMPVHLFMRVDEIGSSLKMAAVNPEALNKHLEKNPKAISLLKRKDHIVFTATSEELQAFVMKHAEGEELFGGPFTLAREASKQAK